jgi:hypothetical protein
MQRGSHYDVSQIVQEQYLWRYAENFARFTPRSQERMLCSIASPFATIQLLA